MAHEVTGILLEVQAAQVSGHDAAQIEELLDRLDSAGLRALEPMEGTLRTLRESEGRPLTEQPPARAFGLADLIDRFVIGAAPPEVEDAVYRLVLEALINIRRHSSRATRFSVSATRSSVGAVSVSVADHGGRKALRTRNRLARPRHRSSRLRGPGEDRSSTRPENNRYIVDRG
ncbi:hypothetical protein ACFC1T_04785 [Kitasatospora sp. NPDC056076]|uniref:hypothetical protein n=1 Tax=Kitasatospora sp. NPDC056076 TaxID=3345703 RepID=UPI0035DE80D1